MTAPKGFFAPYGNKKYFVETGSCDGAGIENAINCGFQNILSVELAEVKYKLCSNKFMGDKKVKLFFGDSTLLLEGMIKDINEPVVFWLDGHWSSGETAKGEGYKVDGFPIFEELEVIKRHPIKTHTLLIDDINPKDDWVEELVEAVKSVNPEYSLSYERGAQPEGYILIAEIKK